MSSWIKHPGNPVFGGPELGTCFDVQIIPNGDGLRMFFSWRPKKSIAFTDSRDGVHWSDPVIVLPPAPESGWEDAVNRQCVLKHGGSWFMWYTGQANGGSCIGLAKSADGVHFTRIGREPVMRHELEWEKISVMNPYVIFDGERGVFRMWYAGGETYEPNALGYAESADGIRWEKSPLNPVFTHGTEYYDQDRVGGCEVLRLPDGRWIMFYIGYENIDLARICAAVSPDGITGWERLAGNPLVSPDAEGFDADACYKPALFFDEKNNRWMLWYNGRRGHDEYVGLCLHEGGDPAQ